MVKKSEKMFGKNQKKTCHKTFPPQQFHRFRIILGKLVAKSTHHTNQDATLTGLYILIGFPLHGMNNHKPPINIPQYIP